MTEYEKKLEYLKINAFGDRTFDYQERTHKKTLKHSDVFSDGFYLMAEQMQKLVEALEIQPCDCDKASPINGLMADVICDRCQTLKQHYAWLESGE